MKLRARNLFLPVFFLLSPAIAQIPPQPGERGGSGYDHVIEMPPDLGDRVGTFTSNGKTGLKVNDSVVIPAIYDKLDYLEGTLYLATKGVKVGAVDKRGTLVLPLAYDSIAHLYFGNSILLRNKGKWGSADLKGRAILPLQYDSVLFSGSDNRYSYAVRNGQRMLLYGDKILGNDLSSIAIYGDAVIAKKEGRFGLLHRGAVTVPFVYDSLYLLDKPAFAAKSGMGFWDHRSTASVFIVKLREQYGLVKADGTMAFPADNDQIRHDPLRHIFLVRKDSLHAIYFEHSNRQTALEYGSIYTDGAQYINVSKGGRHGMIDYAGNTVLPFEYEKIEIMGLNTSFRVTKNGKKGWLRSNGSVVIPIVYDELDHFTEGGFKGLYTVQLARRAGVIDTAGKVIVPLQFQRIHKIGNFLLGHQAHDGSGLYSREGKVICRPEYRWFKASTTRGSALIYAYKDSLFGIIDGRGTVLYPPVLQKAGYITGPTGLLNPFTTNKYSFLYLKDRSGKYGVLEEKSGKTVIPLIYDDVLRKFETDSATFFAVRKGKKSGLISSSNRIVIPFDYDSISLDLAGNIREGVVPQVVVKKGRHFGALTLDRAIAIPFEYTSLVKLDAENRYKACKGTAGCSLINGKNEPVTKAVFDDIAQFEGDRALSFYQGMMKVIDKDGRFLTGPVPMQPHDGYTTFEALKWSLIHALNSPDQDALREVARKMAPSGHILYFLKTNMFSGAPLGQVDVADIQEKYYQALLRFKSAYWNSEHYRQKSLTETDDYTLYEAGYTTNKRIADHAFGNSRYMEKILRNAIKVNGYWISSYFINNSFGR